VGQGILVGCGIAAFGGVRHWMVNNGTSCANNANSLAAFNRKADLLDDLLPGVVGEIDVFELNLPGLDDKV
jgi:hypothetical protein